MREVGENGNGRSLFMEDYTYNLEPGEESIKRGNLYVRTTQARSS